MYRTFPCQRRTDSKVLGARPSEPPSVTVSSSSEKSLRCIYLPGVSRLRHQLFSQKSHRPMVSLHSHPSSYRAGQPLQSCNLHTAFLQQITSPDDLEPTPTGFLSTQRAPTDEQHHQKNNATALNKDRIGMQSHRGHRLEAMPPSYSTASPARSHAGTGRQLEVRS